MILQYLTALEKYTSGMDRDLSRCSIGHAESRSIAMRTPTISGMQFSLLKLCENVRALIKTTHAASIAF